MNPGPNTVLLNLCLTTSVGILDVQDSVLYKPYCCSGLEPAYIREWGSSASTRGGKNPGNLSSHRQTPLISTQTLFCVISALFFLCTQPVSLQKQHFGEVQVFGGSCGGTLGRAEYHHLTGNWGGEKEHLVSVVKTKKDESLGYGKDWAEGRVSGYHYLQPETVLCLQQQWVSQALMAQGLSVLVVRIGIETLCW